MSDRQIVEAQIRRVPRSAVEVVTRCHLGLPVVTRVPPILDDGTPFPTSFWLTCPLARRRIGRVEAAGGVKAAQARLAADPEEASIHEARMLQYARERDAQISVAHQGPAPSGGVAGSTRGVKCLHAHYADFAAGNKNAVGGWTAHEVEPLDCEEPCVAAVHGDVIPNPSWVEPSRPVAI